MERLRLIVLAGVLGVGAGSICAASGGAAHCAAGSLTASGCAPGGACCMSALVEEGRRLATSAGHIAAVAGRWVATNVTPERLSALAERGAARVEGAIDGIRTDVEAVAAEVGRERVGMWVFAPGDNAGEPHPGASQWVRVEAAEAPALSPRLVLLVHGLDEPGSIWDDLGPALHASGHQLVKFDYPNDQAIARTAEQLGDALRTLHGRGVRSVDLVCHSMGGLAARDALTRPGIYSGRGAGHDDLPDVERLLMIGTPNHGSPLAGLRIVGEWREQIARWAGNDWRGSELLGGLSDGRGEAGGDLATESEYLKDLNDRPLPGGVAITIIAGELGPGAAGWLTDVMSSSLAAWAVSEEGSLAVIEAVTAWSDGLGDGVVACRACRLEGVDDFICLPADHRSIVRSFDSERWLRAAISAPMREPPAIAIVLDRLAKPTTTAR